MQGVAVGSCRRYSVEYVTSLSCSNFLGKKARRNNARRMRRWTILGSGPGGRRIASVRCRMDLSKSSIWNRRKTLTSSIITGCSARIAPSRGSRRIWCTMEDIEGTSEVNFQRRRYRRRYGPSRLDERGCGVNFQQMDGSGFSHTFHVCK